MDDAFYLAFLRARKFNVDKTVKLVRRYGEMRRRYPDVCRFAAASKHRRFHETRAVTVTLDRGHFEAPVIIAKIGRRTSPGGGWPGRGVPLPRTDSSIPPAFQTTST